MKGLSETWFSTKANREIRDTLYTRGPNSLYTKYGGEVMRPHKSGKRSYPYVKKSIKTQHGRIPETRNRRLLFGLITFLQSFYNICHTKSSILPIVAED